ncbi:MAG TPA: hypothetical protein VFP84_29740 [Kofleriaceae bacterium]|nr:hypothetical protein [Kofleriaceae bacterium]
MAISAALALAIAGCARRPAHKRTGDAGAAVEVVPSTATPATGATGATGAAGAASDEVEPNDTSDAASALALGATVHGKIEPEADVDRFRIDVTQAGALAVMVSAQGTLDLVLEIEDASGQVIARSDRGGARVREGVPNLGVTPGRYVAVVRGKKPAAPGKKKKAEPAPAGGGPYDITASLAAPAASAEHEPDDDRGQANDLIAGDTGTGFVGWTGDADVWKVSVEALSAKNALDLEVSAVDGAALTLEIADGVGKPIVKRTGKKGGALAVRGFVPQVPAGAPPFHYLTVRADRSNPETAYQIKATAKVIPPDAELEPDDTPETAMAMPADRKSLHAQWSPGDVDCFAIAAQDAAHTVEASIDMPSELDLAIEIVVDGKVVARSDHPGKGAAEQASASVAAGTVAVVRVRGGDGSDEGNYDLVVNDNPAP